MRMAAHCGCPETDSFSGRASTSSSFANSRRFFCGCFVIIIVIQIVICEDANAWVNDMKKTDLAQKILAGVGSLTNTPVNDFNKKVLSDLANAEFTGDVDDKAVETAEKLLTAFLDDTWADQPQAHKYVIGSCLALAFLFKKPLHPQEKVNYIIRVEDGKELYFCPYNEKGTLCDFCAANPMIDGNGCQRELHLR